MAIPHTLTDKVLRAHDQAVYEWLAGLNVDYGNVAGRTLKNRGILRCLASPRRAFASMAKILIAQKWIEFSDPVEELDYAEAFKIVPLPFASIHRQTPMPKEDKANIPMVFRRFRRTSSGFEAHRFPLMYQIPYQIDDEWKRTEEERF